MRSICRSVIVGFFIVNILLSFYVVFAAPSVVINEAASSNLRSLYDEDGDSSDWIELYNPTTESVRLDDFYLTDNPGAPHKWRFPDVVISPRSFLVVFASKKDRLDGAELHTNFKISADGETILLTSAKYGIADTVIVPPLEVDHTYGRLPDGGDVWSLLHDPSPGSPNVASNEDWLDIPQFSHGSGFYTNAVNLSLVAEDSVLIYYTLDGSLPDTSTFLFKKPIFIDTTTVVRAVAFAADGRSSKIVTASLLFEDDMDMPVLSLTTDPENLWDSEIGIFAMGENAREDYPYKGANFWREWERPVHIEFFEQDKRLAFAADAGVRIFGHSSVGAPNKPLVFYARREYGSGSFKHQIFPDKDIHEFEAFMLRNSGNDWNRTLFRDAFMHTLAAEIHLPGQAYRPALVYINGRYWGLYNLRERMNEHYVASNFHVDADDIDLMAWNYGLQVYQGDDIAFQSMRQFVQKNDLSDPEKYAYASSLIHVDNFIDYFIMETFCNNRDWPFNNQYFWRPRGDDGRWMWLLKDMDHGFGFEVSYNYNALARHALKDDLFPHFIENSEFRIAFINRFTFLLNTLFQPDHVKDVITNIKSRIEPSVPRHLERWAGVEPFGDPPTTIEEWRAYCDELYEFADMRPAIVQKQLKDQFGLGDLVQVSINIESPDMGSLRIENQPLPSSPWIGTFYKGVPLTLAAKPLTGYKFTGWKGVAQDADSISFVPNGDMTITATFDQLNSHGISVVINEINYRSTEAFDPGDWIELANPTSTDFRLAGWTLRDDDDDHVFSFKPDAVLPAFSYLILCRDQEKFARCFPNVQNIIDGLEFGLSSTGDAVRLYDEYGVLIDAVTFGVQEPWPVDSNGRGASLALMHPFKDNSRPGSWFASFPHGSPGLANIRFAPITIHNFSVASFGDNEIELQWAATTDDIGNVFRVQRNDGDGWRVIGDYNNTRNVKKNFFEFIDRDITPQALYRLEYTNSDGLVCHSSVLSPDFEDASIVPQFENFPNPFNSTTILRFTLSEKSNVDVQIFNVRGQQVAQPVNGIFTKGAHSVAWNSRDLPSGLYFCKIIANNKSEILKITLQR